MTFAAAFLKDSCAGQSLYFITLPPPSVIFGPLPGSLQICLSEYTEIVATAQNLGHSDVLTTLRSYGQISRERQRALITGESEDDVLED